MAPTSRNNRRSVSTPLLDGWFFAHEKSKKSPSESKRSEMGDFIGLLWPVGLEYASPLNAIFLGEYLYKSNRQPVCMARDGLVPLLWFFKNHPTPLPRTKQFFVHSSFSSFVPNAWRKITGTYEIVSTHGNQAKPSTGRKFLLGGIMMDTFCSLKHLESRLDWVLSKISRAELSKSEILVFLPPRLSGWGTEHIHDFHANYMITLCERLGSHVKALSWRTLDSIPTLEGYEWIELNEGLMCADSYLTHHVLRRGAVQFGEKFNANERSSDAEMISLSPYHGVLLKRRLKGKCVLEDRSSSGREFNLIKAQFEKAMQSEANSRFPWPEWFQSWANGVHRANLSS